MKKIVALSLVFTAAVSLLYGQRNLVGSVVSEQSGQPVEYANIGIVGKNVGTVSDQNGSFSLTIAPQHEKDSLRFSIIGYEAQSVKISNLKEKGSVVSLKEKTYLMDEIVVKPKQFKEREFGISANSKLTRVGFSNNFRGYELGLLMKNKKKALLKSVSFNIAYCHYDSLFFRLNVYEADERSDFENVLREPIYLNFSKKEIEKGTIQVDLKKHDIVVNGNFLVTLEHVNNLVGGYRELSFCAGLRKKTYIRKTSQGSWETLPIGVSISVVADVER